MTDQPRLELADYVLAAEIEKHITVEQEDSVRPDWWRASCGLHDWYTTGSESNVEVAGAEHVARDHPPCAAPAERGFVGTKPRCRLLPDHVGDHANGRYTWPRQPDHSPEYVVNPFPPGHRYLCPISTCSWTYDAPPPPTVDPAGLAYVFGPGVMSVQAVNHYRTKIESVLEDHFKRHPTAEYIAEITNQKNLNIGLVQQMQQLSDMLREALKNSAALRREVDPAVQLSLAVQPGILGQLKGF